MHPVVIPSVASDAAVAPAPKLSLLIPLLNGDEAVADATPTPASPHSPPATPTARLAGKSNAALLVTITQVLEQAVQNTLAVIPAERCLIFMYDKAKNVLTAQVSSWNDEDEEEVSFSPILGMVSAAFLHKKCLRMQEPHHHRAFFKDHDVPRDMDADSIMCAPITLHHRAIGVIELINRGESNESEETTDPTDPSPLHRKSTLVDDDQEIKLRRSRTQRVLLKPGFTSKDEQNLIQLASHVAQTIDQKMKQMPSSAAAEHARIREEQAQKGLELLNMLNDKLLLKPEEPPSPSAAVRAPAPRGGLASIDSYNLFVRKRNGASKQTFRSVTVIVKLQAAFRGRQERKIHDVLSIIRGARVAKRRIQHLITIQRFVRRFLVRQAIERQHSAVAVIERAYRHHLFTSALSALHKARKRQKRHSVFHEPKHIASSRRTVHNEFEAFSAKLQSAVTIQRQYRGHTVRKVMEKTLGFGNFSKALKNIVKLQSFVRGGLARQHVKKLKIKRAGWRPHKVGMRVASTDNQTEVDPNRCKVYPLPPRAPQAHVALQRSLATRDRLERDFDKARAPRRDRAVDQQVRGETEANANVRNRGDFLIETRRLRGCSNQIENATPRPIARSAVEDVVTASTLAKAHPTYLFDLSKKKGKRSPAAVQFFDEYILSTRLQARARVAMHDLTSGPASTAGAPVGLSPPRSAPATLAHDHANAYRTYAFQVAVGKKAAVSPRLPTLTSPTPPTVRAHGAVDLLCCLAPVKARATDLTSPLSPPPMRSSRLRHLSIALMGLSSRHSSASTTAPTPVDKHDATRARSATFCATAGAEEAQIRPSQARPE